ncbi:MAG TPA: baseplate J/gp47 family protein [Polyangiaceae bacterium]|nr:baseplate J/gp47 family protein [Polyangiaceae bacterium]
MNTPTTQSIASSLLAQLEGQLEHSFLPKSFTDILAKAIAGTYVLVYKYAGFILLQQFVAYATDKPTRINGKVIRPLVEWGRLVGAGDPKPATRAELQVLAVVQSQSGDIPAGAQLTRTEKGVIYTVVASVALNAPTVKLIIRASSDPSGGGGAGTIGNLVAGDTVDFVNPRGVEGKATVLAVLTQGADAEQTEAYRARVIRHYKRKAKGGAPADYQDWAEEVPGVARAIPVAAAQPNEVNVYVRADNNTGVPSAALLNAVKESIQKPKDGRATRRPINAAVNVLGVTRRLFDVRIIGLSPDTPAIREKLKAGIAEYLSTREPYVEGLSTLPRNDRITQAALNGIADAIVAADGAQLTSLVLLPGPSYVLQPHEIAALGSTVYE